VEDKGTGGPVSQRELTYRTSELASRAAVRMIRAAEDGDGAGMVAYAGLYLTLSQPIGGEQS
jgi:hypothetical protein